MKGYELIAAVEQAAHKICSALGLRPVSIEWSPSVPTAAISASGNIILKDVAADSIVPRSMLDRYVGFVVHELLHRKYTDFTARDRRRYVDALHNAVEDIWIERQGVAAGLTGNITALLTSLINGMVTEALDQNINWADPAQYPFALAVHGRRYATVKVPLAGGLKVIFNEASKRIDTCKSSHDTLKVARWVFDQLQQDQDQPDQPDQADQEATESSDDADKGEGKGEGDQANGESADGSGGDSDGEGDGAGDGEGNGSGEGEGSGDADGDGSGSGDGDGEGAGKRQAPSPTGPARQVEPQCPDGGEASGGGAYCRDKAGRRWEHSVRGGDTFQTQVVAGGRLRYEVKRLFDNSDRSDWAINRKAGALNVRALPSITVGSDRVFKRRDEVDGIDSAVMILLDNSSSMFERTNARKKLCLMDYAVPTVVALHQAIRAAGGAVAVASFGWTVHKVADWGTPTAKAAQVLAQIGDDGMTNDAQAIRFCGDILLQRNEQRRILFVITDGVGDGEMARANVEALERLGITVIGVGIELNVSGVYNQNITVRDINDLASASFKQIKVAI